jgi:lipopolysaccharide/colanic/teichoic acid biosynthesis glycosyltransferase
MTKRAADIALGVVLALIALPLVTTLAVISAVMFRCWPFFTQERVGLGGATFRIVKIRTLPRTTPALADKYAIASVALPVFARFLRATHLDELPQLLLVPSGHMSLVGPRPEMRFLHDGGDPAFARLRTSVRPGCTGLWQISRTNGQLIWQAPEYDEFYVRHACVRLDLWILAQTLQSITPFSRAITLEDVPRWVLPRTDKRLAGPQTQPPVSVQLREGFAALRAAGTPDFLDLTADASGQTAELAPAPNTSA